MVEKSVLSRMCHAVAAKQLSARSYFLMARALGFSASIALAAILTTTGVEASIDEFEGTYPEELRLIEDGVWPNDEPNDGSAESNGPQDPQRVAQWGDWDDWGNWDNWGNWDDWGNWDNWGNWDDWGNS